MKWATVSNSFITKQGILPSPIGADNIVKCLDLLQAGHDNLPVALAIAGDVLNGKVLFSPHLELVDFEPSVLLKGEVACCVNDITAACAGEIEGNETLAHISIGTGVGGKIAYQGSVIEGAHGSGGEVGHSQMPGKSDLCTCGHLGCVELYCGWKGLQHIFANKHGYQPLSPKEIMQDKQIANEALDAISFAASILVAACDPVYLRIGGGISQSWGEFLITGAQQRLPSLCWTGKNVSIGLAQETGALLGIAYIAHQRSS